MIKAFRMLTGAAMLLSWLFLVNGACSPQKRLQRLVNKHPELMSKDTIRINDTVWVKGVQKDTVFHYREFHERILDTIKIERDNLRVEIWRIDSMVYVDAECKDTMLVRDIAVPVDRIVVHNRNGMPNWVFWLLIGISATSLTILFFKK